VQENDLRRIKATILIAQKRLNVSAVNSENFILQNALPLLKCRHLSIGLGDLFTFRPVHIYRRIVLVVLYSFTHAMTASVIMLRSSYKS